MHVCMCLDGGMYGCPADAHLCVLRVSISQRALFYIHARMHAYNACVVRALRHLFVSRLIKPQGSGGVIRTFLGPFSSLLFAFANNPNSIYRDLALACQPARRQPLLCMCLLVCRHSARGQCRATDTETTDSTQTQHATRTSHIYILYFIQYVPF